MVVGLTGGIGSGKTTVLNLFREHNVAVYIADVEAKQLMNTSTLIKEQLVKEFGLNVYKENKLNRPFLAEIVFKDKNKLKILNSIVHPEVYKHLNNFIKKNSDKDYIVYENAILFENGSDTLCDKIITVTAPKLIRIQRVLNRDNTTEKEVLQRIANQWKEEKKLLQSNYIIENIELKDTQKTVQQIHNFLTQKK
ncbi:MAG: dephospho-CoA kinase [Flavobacteriaceae bacterium]